MLGYAKKKCTINDKSWEGIVVATDTTHEEVYETWLLIQRTAYDIRRLREYELQRDTGITMSQAAALLALKSAEEPLTPSDLARMMQRQAHSVHEMINRMEKDGLVRKVRHTAWKRKVFVELTALGEETHRKAKDMRLSYDIITSLSARKRNSLRSHLQKLRLKALTELVIMQKGDV